MNWHDDTTNLDDVAAAMLKSKRCVTAKCCNKPDIHIHAVKGLFKFRKDYGSAWIWCSCCGAFSHLDGIPISADWINNPDINMHRLTAVPSYLETVKSSVDTHLIRFLR